MIKLTPSILAADLLHLGKEVEQMAANGIDRLHFDVMDAHFVPNLSFGPSFCQAIHRQYPGIMIDVHLMMDNPDAYLPVFARAGAASLTVHTEAVLDICGILGKIRKLGAACGLSIKPGTDVEVLWPYLDILDVILIMTVEPGFGGQKFMRDQVQKIRAIRDKGFRGSIAVDGGVDLENAPLLIDAGASWLVMGTAYFQAPDPAEVARAIKEYA